MEGSLIARFVDAFIAGFFKTMKEKIIDIGLLLTTLLYWFFSGKVSAHFWESVAPWIWVICAVVMWHSVSAARLLFGELKQQEVGSRKRERSLVLSQYGDPLELPKTQVPMYRTKIVGIVVLIWGICMVCSYAVRRVAYPSNEKVAELSSQPIIEPSYDLKLIGLPIGVKPLSTIDLVLIQADRTVQLQGVVNDKDVPLIWPTREPITPPEQAGEIRVVNHGNIGVFNVSYPITAHIGAESDPGGTAKRSLELPLFDLPLGGPPVIFYIVNQSSYVAVIELSRNAVGIIQGERTRRNIEVSPRAITFFDKIPVLKPSFHKWSGTQILEPNLWRKRARNQTKGR
jgi:hypothetical protein